MALKDTKREFQTQLTDSTDVANYCAEHFRSKGYTVEVESTASGSFLSLTKGGSFKSISGMKTGLNITLAVSPGTIEASMEVGIFGKQALPAAISLLVFWPMLIPQIYGIVQQNELDKEAYKIIEKAIHIYEASAPKQYGGKFCPYCGKVFPSGSLFCPGCGTKIEEECSVCPNCGTQPPEGSAFCPNCGTRVK